MGKLPRSKIIQITDRKAFCSEKAFLSQIQSNLNLGISAIYLREKDLPDSEYLNLSLKVLNICQRVNAQLILPGSLSFLDKIPVALIQAGKMTPSILNLRKKWGKEKTIGFSAHSLKEATRAEKEGANYLFFSPIFSSPSKPDLKPLGLEPLKSVCEQLRIPVYALGGINEKNLAQVMKTGAYGFTSISSLQNSQTTQRMINLLKKFCE